MGILAWIILGLVAGLIAQAITKRGSSNILITMLLGIGGALLGGFLAQALLGVDGIDNFFDIGTWITAIVGASIAVFVYSALTSRRRA